MNITPGFRRRRLDAASSLFHLQYAQLQPRYWQLFPDEFQLHLRRVQLEPWYVHDR